MIKTFTLVISIIFIHSAISKAQDSTENSSWSISGYVDAYGAYYTDSVGTSNYQKFPTVSPRSKQFGLNIAMVTAKYSADRVRGIIALHYGDIPKSSWSNTYNFIQEANVGFRISKGLWLDGGFFRSHIGCEGLLPKENITSSISVPTFFEPYFEAGFKLNYVPTNKLALNLFVLNGYNIYEDNNTKKSGGVLATYSISDRISMTYANYFGDDTPEGDSITHFRFLNNIYLNYIQNKVRIVTGVDFGFQQNSDLTNLKKSASMWSGIFAMSYQAAKKFAIYGRGEVYRDPDGILSGVFMDQNNKLTGLKLWGITLGLEYKPTDNSYIRIEGRSLTTDKAQKIFRWDNDNKNNRLEAMLNMGITFP